MKPNRIAYVINHLSFFNSHILPLAVAAKKKGFILQIFCGAGGSYKMEKEAKKIMQRNGIKYTKLEFQPGMGSFISEINFIIKVISKITKFNPDIVHGISLKGILFSCIYSLIYNPKKLICYITGMGYFFTNKLNYYEKLIRYFLLKIIKLGLSLKNSILVLENQDDLNYFYKKVKISKKKIIKIKGTGVDLEKFDYLEKKKKNIVIFPARVLQEKGIFEFLAAGNILSKKYSDWKFFIAGTLDYKKNNKNYTRINYDKFINNKNIKFLGYRNDMNNLFNKSSIACLPSYREGFPKSLIEASASGCAIVTTNVPGCREIIRKNINGFLCKVKNTEDLLKYLEKLISNKELRLKFSKNSRKIALMNFDFRQFVTTNIKLYY